MKLGLRVSNIAKTYNGNEVLKECSYSFKQPGVYVLTGANGCGKSTFLRICSLLEAPDRGEIIYFDERGSLPRDIPLQRRITLVLPKIGLFNTTVSRNVSYGLRVRGIRGKEATERVERVLEFVGLSHKKDQNARTLSSGETQRVGIARGLVIETDILFLDEPTIGLDPEARHEVWLQIAKLNEEKTTIILTTHYMDEAEKLCNRIAFMDKGRLIALDVLENLKQLIPSGDLIEIGFDTGDDRIIPAFRENSMITSVKIKDQKLIISAKNGSKVLPGIVAVMEKFSVPMTSISIRSPSLEDVFIHLTGKKLDNGGQPEVIASRGREPL